jgi:hypothetical protein
MEGWSDGVFKNVLVQLTAIWCNQVQQRTGTLNSNTPMLHNSNTPFHFLALPLFVTRIGANDADDAFALNDFAVFAKFLN